MTTIACDGRQMAADGQVTDDENIITEIDDVKVERLKDGSIIALAGAAHARPALRAFLEGKAAAVEACGQWDALRLMPNGSGLYYSDKHPTFGIRATWPAALGSGSKLAMGAMLAGASAKKAVEIACQRDIGSSGKITVLSIRQ